MSIIALVNPTDLLGKEIRQALEQRRELWTDLRLLTLDEAESGALTELADAAALVQLLEDDDALDDVGTAIFCGPIEKVRPVLDRLSPATTAIIASADAGPEDGEPIVAGVNLRSAARGATLMSPQPAAIGLAHVLAPLADFGLSRATATILRPASAHGSAGVDEILEQSRRILGLQPDPPTRVFGTQMAFNVIPANTFSEATLAHHVRRAVGLDFSLTTQTLQTGVFHSYGLSIYVELDDDPGVGTLRATLDEHPAVQVVDDPETLGPIRAANEPNVLVGEIRDEPRQPGGYWLWAVLDNLTAGGAGNVLQIVEAVSQSLAH